MQLILVFFFFFFWDELVKVTINREQTRQKLGKLQKLGTVKRRLKKRTEAIKSQTHLKRIDSYKLTQQKLR